MNLSNQPDSRSDEEIPGLWPSSISNEHCCIYRVPSHLRRVNPEAYTPQMLLIGPLHHSKKFSKTDLRYLDYINMERCKNKYLKETTNTYGEKTVEEFRRIIERDEQIIRASYAESTEWIKSKEFVEMILYDSVFILHFMIQFLDPIPRQTRDVLFDQPCLLGMILDDLRLLENQLPFALLTELFEPFFLNIKSDQTFRDKLVRLFGFRGKIKRDVMIRHVTDLFRHVHVVTLGLPEDQIYTSLRPDIIMSMHNADMLNCAGVDFVVDKEDKLSLAIRFEGRILTMPCFTASDETEKILRNIMALEQCHYSTSAFVCNYIDFLAFLIDTEQAVDLLVKKGIIKNGLESGQGSVTKMVRKLCEGLAFTGSNYYPISQQLNEHCKRRLNTLRVNLSIATLRRVYFKDLWTGTATLSAVVLLVMTLIGTVASVLQVTQNDNKSPAPT